MENKIREYLKKPYSRILIPDSETGRYTAQILEFQGCFSEGSTPQRAYKNLEKAAYNWLESAIKQGMQIPAPFSFEGYSGKIALRLPKSLHRQAMHIAKRDGISLNQFLVAAVANSVGAENLYQRIVDQINVQVTSSWKIHGSFVAGTPLDYFIATSEESQIVNLVLEPHTQELVTVASETIALIGEKNQTIQ
jgi:predicted RNase H-like HicB family nuclease